MKSNEEKQLEYLKRISNNVAFLAWCIIIPLVGFVFYPFLYLATLKVKTKNVMPNILQNP